MVFYGGKPRRATWCRRCRNCSESISRTRRYPKTENERVNNWKYVGNTCEQFKIEHLSGFTVVWLRLSVSAGVTPVSSVTLRRGTDLGTGARPEPSVDVLRLKIRPVAAVEVTLAAGSPDEPYVTCERTLIYRCWHGAHKDNNNNEVSIFQSPRASLCLMNSFSCGVSRDTASIQCLRQMLRASNQSTSKDLVGWCSQLKKYECATPLASL